MVSAVASGPRVSSTSQTAAISPIRACAISFTRARDAFVVVARQLQVVVGETQRAVAQRDEQHRPDIEVAQIHPQQRGDRQRGQDQHAAHRRRALLLDQMPLRPIAADRLAVPLQRFQPADHRRPENEADDQRGQARGARAERDVAEQVEQDELVGERPRRGRYSIRRPPRVVSSALTTSFIRLPRLPLIRTASPGASARATIGASAAESWACAPRIAAGTAANSSAHQRPAGEQAIGTPQQHRRPARGVRRGRRRPVPACRPARRRAASPAAAAAPPAPRASRRDCRCSSRPAAARCRPATAICRRAPRPLTGAKPSSARPMRP